jgi:hypothetical protein
MACAAMKEEKWKTKYINSLFFSQFYTGKSSKDTNET